MHVTTQTVNAWQVIVLAVIASATVVIPALGALGVLTVQQMSKVAGAWEAIHDAKASAADAQSTAGDAKAESTANAVKLQQHDKAINGEMDTRIDTRVLQQLIQLGVVKLDANGAPVIVSGAAGVPGGGGLAGAAHDAAARPRVGWQP